jgi:hypothetical protein
MCIRIGEVPATATCESTGLGYPNVLALLLCYIGLALLRAGRRGYEPSAF